MLGSLATRTMGREGVQLGYGRRSVITADLDGEFQADVRTIEASRVCLHRRLLFFT